MNKKITTKLKILFVVVPTFYLVANYILNRYIFRSMLIEQKKLVFIDKETFFLSFRRLNRLFENINIALPTILFILVIGFIYYHINKKIKYIDKIHHEVVKLGEGNFDISIPLEGEDELTDLAKNVNNISKELGSMIENERALIQNVSHDLRTPLTLISGYLQLLGQEGLDEETRAEYHQITSKKVLELEQYISSFLELSTSNVSTSNKQEPVVHLTHLLEEYIALLEKNNFNVSFLNNTSQEDTFECDLTLVRRVLDNLYSNIVKYAKDQVVELKLESENDALVLVITNSTDEVTIANIENLQKRFFKLDETSEDSHGLGLEIVSNLLDLQQAKLEINGQNNKLSFKIKFKR